MGKTRSVWVYIFRFAEISRSGCGSSFHGSLIQYSKPKSTNKLQKDTITNNAVTQLYITVFCVFAMEILCTFCV